MLPLSRGWTATVLATAAAAGLGLGALLPTSTPETDARASEPSPSVTTSRTPSAAPSDGRSPAEDAESGLAETGTNDTPGRSATSPDARAHGQRTGRPGPSNQKSARPTQTTDEPTVPEPEPEPTVPPEPTATATSSPPEDPDDDSGPGGGGEGSGSGDAGSSGPG
ncbi:MAG: hypothetical protein ACRDYU_15510 [Actinomycetes bacterium]